MPNIGPSILGVFTKFGISELPTNIEIAVFARFERTPHEDGNSYAVRVIDQSNGVLGSAVFPKYSGDPLVELVDAMVMIPITIRSVGRFSVLAHSTTGSDSAVTWFDVDKPSIN